MINNHLESLRTRPLDLRHVRTFVVVAEQRHFGHAAALLEISQPAVSKQVHQLELQIGVQLLDRSSRQVELTSAGEAFFNSAHELLDHASCLALRAGRAARDAAGQLTIGFRDSASNDFLPDLIQHFRAAFPNVKLLLREFHSGLDQCAALRQQRIDVAFVRPPLDDPSLKFDVVLDEELVAVLPDHHPLARRKHVPVRALVDEPFVLWPRAAHPQLYDATFGPNGVIGFVPRVEQEAIGTLSVLGLVAAGLGVSLLPSSVLSLTRESVALRALAPPVPLFRLGIVRRAKDRSKVVANFVKVALGLLPNNAGLISQHQGCTGP